MLEFFLFAIIFLLCNIFPLYNGIVYNLTFVLDSVKFSCISEAKAAIERYELQTTSRYSIYKKDKEFGKKGNI